MKRISPSNAAHRAHAHPVPGRQLSRVLWWLAALSMATATTFAVPVHQIRMAGALLNGVIGQYGTPAGSSAAIHVIWKKDVTTTPPISAVTPAVTGSAGSQGSGGSSSGSSVAGYCQVHFSYPPPPSSTQSGGSSQSYTSSNPKELRIHSDAASDSTTDQVQTNLQWNQVSSHAWRANCGDPDPSDPKSLPIMI